MAAARVLGTQRAVLPCRQLPRITSCTSWQPACRAARSLQRCLSTASPSQPPSDQPPSDQRISWLCSVERLQPASSSSSSANSNGNGGQPRQHTFCQLSEADLAPGANSDPFDAIMVLAGGLTRDGGLPEWVHRRLDVARDLHMLQGKQPAIVCLGGGTPHKPDVLGPSGHVIHESTSCASYLTSTGVDPQRVFKEVSSYDTVGNAYFGLTIHALPAGWRRLAVVTSAFHMPRTRALFAGVYGLAGRALAGDPDWHSLTFLSASDEGVFDDHVYAARLEKEADSLAHWTRVEGGLRDLRAFHAWLYAEHLCYAVPRQAEFGKRTIQDARLLESY